MRWRTPALAPDATASATASAPARPHSRALTRVMDDEVARATRGRAMRAQAGDMTLVDSLGSVQLAIAAAISKAFKTPEARAARRCVPCLR